MDRLRPFFVACLLALPACGGPNAIVLNVTGDAPATQYDLYVHDDDAGQIIFHSGFTPFAPPGAPPVDLTMKSAKIALKLSGTGKFTVLLVGVVGDVVGSQPAPGATQMFWATRLEVNGTTTFDARLLTVQPGDDQDGDLWPDVNTFLSNTPAAAPIYGSHLELLDCDDKMDFPVSPVTMMASKVKAADINPFANEICGDGIDEDCNGADDEACVDNDHDHDFKGDDCDDNDPTRHHPTDIDPFPDPPNCCGYSLGKVSATDQHTDYLHPAGDPNCFAATCAADMMLCPKQRCGDGIDESCSNMDTPCVVDDDCDGYPAPPQGNDCDDHDPNVHPGAPESCSATKDLNCDGVIGGCVPCDLDGDGYERMDAANGCPDAKDKHPGMVDCNDWDSGVFPGETATFGGKEGSDGKIINLLSSAERSQCRRIYESSTTVGNMPATARVPAPGNAAWLIGDFDCNGVAYENCPSVACDADGDGFPNATAGCNPNNITLDCDDTDPTVFPSAPDKCGDGKASNCTPPDTPCSAITDADGDGYAANVDCNDHDPTIHPWAPEICDGVDNDCDGLVDENNPDATGVPMVATGAVTTCTDSDIGECGKTLGTCVCSATSPAPFITPATRLACPTETMAGALKPPRCVGAGQPKMQSCNATTPKDDDCDGNTDDPMGLNLAIKGQPCGITGPAPFGQCKAGLIVGCDHTKSNCFTTFGRTTPDTLWYVCSTDTICPSTEVCDGIDNDCDGNLAGSAVPPTPGQPTADERDHDGDLYVACGPCAGTLRAGLLGCSDCDDTNPNIHPGAKENCNNVDDDCNPATPDGNDQCPGTSLPNCCSSQQACRNLGNDFNNCVTCGMACNNLTANACGGAGCMCGGSPACGSDFWCSGGACTQCNTNTHCGATCVNCTPGGVCKLDGSGCTQCNFDTDCTGTQFCSSGACVAKKSNGGMCSGGNQCTSGNCVDGVCCNMTQANCQGCMQCNGAVKGTCSAVPANNDPHGFCTSPNLATCQGNTCSGTGNNCNLPVNTVCVAQACSGGTQTVSQCNASGGCISQTPINCAPYICNAAGTTCLSSCSVDGDCAAATPFCNGTVCKATRPAGRNCSTGTDCTSTFCVDNGSGQKVCCGSACNNGQSTCTGTTETDNICPLGTCSSPTKNCPPYACKSGACATSCTCGSGAPCLDATNCGANAYCDGTACHAQGTNGTNGCTAGVQCTNGFCVGGICCGSACTGSSCSSGTTETDQVGTCNGGTCQTSNTTCTPYACEGASPNGKCVTQCAADADCTGKNFCATTAYGCKANPSCEPRIASGMPCDTANCQGGVTTCKQCDNGGGGVACPTGSNKNCP